MDISWELREQDRETFAQELDSFVPAKIYDAHAHLYRAEWWDDPPAEVAAGPPDISLEVYRPEYSPNAALPLVGIENLRAVKAACWCAGLNDAQIEDYFGGNAAKLLEME